MRIRSKLKLVILRLGVYYPMSFAKAFPEVLRWLRSGCTGVAPHPIKMRVVKSYLKRFAVGEFVETGTAIGETLDYISRTGVRCTSIELSPELHAYAQVRFKHARNVKLLLGDSSQRLADVLKEITVPTLFWLDGHYSGSSTARGTKNTPIVEELAAILKHPVKGHIILIDDARLFNGAHDYPALDELLRKIREIGTHDVEVSVDIIRLTPAVAT